METLAVYNLEDILKYIPPSKKKYAKKTFRLQDGRTFNVRIATTRLVLFRHNHECVCCGIKGKIFKLQYNGDNNPHLNMFAINKRSKHILMTKDHILPASKGGSDSISNMQTMCARCNCLKSDFPVTLEQLKEVRKEFFNMIRNGISEKVARKEIELMKKKMCYGQQQTGGD